MPGADAAHPSNKALEVPMPDVVRFIRQLSHDLRNQLNAAELQAAYINEVTSDAELKGEVQRLRALISEMAGSLQRVSASLSEVKLTRMPYEASAFLEDLEEKVRGRFPQESASVQWKKTETGEARFNVDPQILQQALIELIANAFQHGRAPGPIELSAHVRNGDFVLELREPKASFEGATQHWGREPFRKAAHGHYGLGLHRARAIVEAHEGRLEARYDPASSSLGTTVVLPLLPPE